MGNNAKVGGILSIVSGGFGVLFGAFYMLLIFFFNFMITNIPQTMPQTPMEPEFPTEFFQIFGFIYGGIGLILALIGVLSIVGGVYALKRKRWGLALAGAIASDIVFSPCGIPALIFVCLGKDEFTTVGPPSLEM
jgi:hypothetical protein